MLAPPFRQPIASGRPSLAAVGSLGDRSFEDHPVPARQETGEVGRRQHGLSVSDREVLDESLRPQRDQADRT